jgi:hypothetical protein
MRMRRVVLIVALCAGCSFDPSGLTTDTTSTDADLSGPDADLNAPDADPSAPDAAPGAPDAAPGAPDAQPPADATPPDPTQTRLIDITDAAVTGGPHANFPILISLSETWLRHTGSGGSVAHLQGFDISFSADAAGTMQLDHEVESYVSSSGVLVAWVRITSLVPTTVLYIHYGDPAITTSQENSQAVWNQGYAAVWHMLGDFADSTQKNSAGANSGSSNSIGWIGAARQFDANNDFINMGSNPAIDNIFAGGGTAEAWFYATGWGEGSYGRIFDKGHTSGWSLYVDDGAVNEGLTFLHGTSTSYRHWLTGSQAVTLNAWHQVVVVYSNVSSGNVPTIYIDGTAQSLTANFVSTNTASDDSPLNLYVGNRSSNDRTFDGTLDEARLSTVSRSAGWITTGYANQRDPAAFYTVGPEL